MNEQFEQHAADTHPASSTAPPIDHQGCLSELQLVDVVVFFLCQNSKQKKKKNWEFKVAAGEKPETSDRKNRLGVVKDVRKDF